MTFYETIKVLSNGLFDLENEVEDLRIEIEHLKKMILTFQEKSK